MRKPIGITYPVKIETPEEREVFSAMEQSSVRKEGIRQMPKRTWVGLTDEEKEHTWKIAEAKGWGWQKMFDHLEAKLKEKNT